MTEVSREQRVAYVLLRVAMGVDFCSHGFVRILHGNAAFAQWMVKHMVEASLPASLVYGFGWILPFLEALLGVLLLAGIWTRGTLTAGALLMMAFMAGTGFLQNWSIVALQIFYSFLFFVLLFLRERYDASWPALLRRG